MNKIEVHIDFACPFSYMGGEKLLQYFENNELSTEDIRFRSFQLQPDDDNTKRNYLENRFKVSDFNTVDEYRDYYNNSIGKAAQRLGLNYDVDKIISTNSIHAHMGLQYATLYSKHTGYFREVMSAHFEKGIDYYDFNFIDKVLNKLNLDVKDFHNREEEMKKLVQEDINLAINRHVVSVPTFYTNQIVIQGTGSIEEFDKLFKK